MPEQSETFTTVRQRIPELLREKWDEDYGPDARVNLSQVARDTNLAYSIVHAWANDRITSFAAHMLCIWANYLERTDLLEYVEADE